MLQGILELQEQAAVADDVLAFLQAAGDLRAAVLAVADFHEAPRELIRDAGLHVDERLVFRVAQARRRRER